MGAIAPGDAALSAALVALCIGASAMGSAQAKARPFAHVRAYSFDAPSDVYLSEDAGGCGNVRRGRRRSGARLLRLKLYPDAYCSLLQAASCRYLLDADVDEHVAAHPQSMPRSSFTAVWDNACVGAEQRLAAVIHGSLEIGDASDLRVFGSYDFILEDGTQLRGVFDSSQCTSPPAGAPVCH